MTIDYLHQGVYFVMWKFSFKFSCQPIDYSRNESGLVTAFLAYCYFLMKIFDLLDTVWETKRKHWRQLKNLCSLPAFHRAQEEELSTFLSPLLSSRGHGALDLLLSMASWRTTVAPRHHQHFRSRHNVFVLFCHCFQRETEGLTVVEKIHYASPTYAICDSLCSFLLQFAPQRLQLPEADSDIPRGAKWIYVCFVCRLLFALI